MGANDGDGDFYSKAEGHIKLVLEQKGRPLDPERAIQRWELLRRDIGLSDEDIGAVLSSALFSRRYFPYIENLNDLAKFIDKMEEYLDKLDNNFLIHRNRLGRRKKS